ncbi:MAG: hypothetical protein HYY22_04265 [Thaumarchaeota archaeon]|nr:hypothetical protein [Nitrososphaerota archaeon]
MSSDIEFLIDVKALAEHGRFHADHSNLSSLDKRLAIHHVHNAIELTLRRKAKELNITANDMPSLIKNLKNQGKLDIPRENDIQELNAARNQSQHSEATFESRHVYRITTNGIEFLKEFFQKYFHADYDTLSLVQLLSNKSIRHLLTEAQAALVKKDYMLSLHKSHCAIDKAKWIVMHNLENLGAITYNGLSFTYKDGKIGELNEKIDEVLDFALFSRYATELSRLKSISRAVFWNLDQDEPGIGYSRPIIGEYNPTSDEAEFAFKLSVEFVRWIDQAFGLSIAERS